ncbi:hypothetical protein R1A27_31460 (plasmid) [Methylobacterium sp. NMS12]|uniref:hypothetical protein n=1 Tax=Methylobacterium sp. NMS12 TaxID=3079766 RepID=UPI003F885D97
MRLSPIAMTVGVFVLATGAVRLLQAAGFQQAPFMVLAAGLIAGGLMMVLRP